MKVGGWALLPVRSRIQTLSRNRMWLRPLRGLSGVPISRSPKRFRLQLCLRIQPPWKPFRRRQAATFSPDQNPPFGRKSCLKLAMMSAMLCGRPVVSQFVGQTAWKLSFPRATFSPSRSPSNRKLAKSWILWSLGWPVGRFRWSSDSRTSRLKMEIPFRFRSRLGGWTPRPTATRMSRG